jgi:hypothetical protein
MDIEALRDYILADMIKEVETMPRERLVRELVAMKAEKIEALNEEEIKNYGKRRK